MIIKKATFASILLGLIMVVMPGGGCTIHGTGTGGTIPGEATMYMGIKLSSINDFRENSIKGPQNIDINSYRLEINGLVDNPRSYTYDEVINTYNHYKKVLELNCVEGWSVTLLWQGILMKDLLADAEPRPEARIVIFHAYDEYTTSQTLDYLVNNDIMLAYMMNDITIPPARGYPFMLAAENKWGYKWCKWITRIELSDNVNYRGFWESRGYSNNGDLDKFYFD